MRRFLSRSSITNRLVALLAVSVVLPGVLLAWYGVRAVLQEERLYEATLRERAQGLAVGLHADLGDRVDRMLLTLDEAVESGGPRWVTDPGVAADRLREAEPLVAEVLVFDSGSRLRHPAAVAAGLIDRRGGETADRSYLSPLLSEGERLELQAGDLAAAAIAYGAATQRITGQRGRGIARLARARTLLKADDPAGALAEYETIIADHAGDRDLNDFPLDLLARYQAVLALTALKREPEAATRLVSLLEDLSHNPWTFGGYGETALATRSLGLLTGGLLDHLRSDDRPDLAALRSRLTDTAELQGRQAQILRLLPALRNEMGAGSRPAKFELISLRRQERTRLFAQRWSEPRNELRQVLVVVDDEALRDEVRAILQTALRATPEFRIDLRPLDGETRPPAEGFQVLHPLEPWLPGHALAVTRGEALLGPAAMQQRMVRLGMIGALLVIILVGIVVIGRAVSREVEIARLKSDFVSSVSHELRTPLTTIRIMAEMLALGAVPTGEKQAEYHRNIVSEAERLTRLINNVLDFARIEEGRKKFQFGMGDIGDAVHEVERITGDYVRKEGFTLTTTVPDDLLATAFDRDAIIQALINLMSNAVKYSKDDRRIEMGVEMVRDSILLFVRDHGPGIDPKDQPHLFEKFYRGGDHMTREVGGTGLGLSIVQHIVSAHRGKVGVTSKIGEGSRFEITLPVQSVEQLAGSEGRR